MPELNSSSIGMAVAALQAINGINLFGPRVYSHLYIAYELGWTVVYYSCAAG
jgi:hypothetical protein